MTCQSRYETQRTVFNMRASATLYDTVDERLARLFLVQAGDGILNRTWNKQFLKKAIRLIRFRLHDVFPQNEMNIWPAKLSTFLDLYLFKSLCQNFLKQ